MNRARLAQLLAFVGVAVVGGTTFTLWRPNPGTTGADLQDAGIAGANRVATCPVRISNECLAARPTLRRYETLRFPVFRDPLADGGVQILLPPASRAVAEGLRDCVEVMDFGHCDLDPVATYPAIAAQWGDSNPFARVRAASKFVVPDCRNPDGGWNDSHAPVACRRLDLPDGGPRWAGCNVFRRTEMVGAACLDAPTGVVFAGERIEESL